ncbi:hypothetical protein ACFSKN_04660 [Mariniflexile gromovii]|uniref:DUF1842 domain-containing protein n=1 Tax=Mariniflexile gromovii TaxID=362523 RepID=A0ABS4BWA2_9FLAO|nr:hypothetical protein [Mariniflexile gromovii]MBP0904861.1 hypothetical protein [Mariniflexile gromovii]
MKTLVKTVTPQEVKQLIKSISNIGTISNDDYGIIPLTDNTIEVNVNFNTIGKLEKFYLKAKSKSFKTNFGGNPYEQNSYMVIDADDYEIIVNAPLKSNGDKNWTAYRWNNINDNDKFKTYAPISIKLKA